MPLKDKIFRLVNLIGSCERFRRSLIWGTHLGLFLASGAAAFLLRFDFIIPTTEFHDLWFGLAVWLVVKSAVFRWLGLDRGWWRFVSVDDVLRIGFGNFTASLAGFLVIWGFGRPGFPRSIYLLDLMVCFVATSGVRILVRMFRENYFRSGSKDEKLTLIYGAGAAGISLLREIRANPKLSYAVCGFVDDDFRKAQLVIQGVRVLGIGNDLPKIVKKRRIEVVLIAIPAASGSDMTRILRLCQEAGITYKTVPGLGEIIEGNGLANQIRNVKVEDLLGRNPVHLDESGIRARIEGRVVAVTGAAGSIGSELCRQVARFRPAAIVAYECAETPLFYIDREMRESFPALPFHSEIGDIRNPRRLSEILERYHPSILYHAAAYKHVPMMEEHAFEAFENNVIGTWNVANAAAEQGVADFVMISSDKAVRPTSMMGVTKRVAELLIAGLQNGGTNYVSVRFGNVLGSSGSVIPLFQQQIAARKPLTITHPDMRRYFMTIPEAAQLVLQAATMGRGGEIFVLDMGEPVKIVDLARNLILLSGLRPEEDIRIEFTGVRPGEKLYEELAHMEEETRPTHHSKIKIFAGDGYDRSSLFEDLDQLRNLCQSRDLSGLVLQLKKLVPDYNPSSHLLRRVVHSLSIDETPPLGLGPVRGGHVAARDSLPDAATFPPFGLPGF